MRSRKRPQKRLTRQTVQKIKFLFGAVLVLFALYYLSFNDYGIVRQFRMRKEIQHIQKQINMLQQQQSRIRETIERLTSDYNYIEKIAREKYLLQKKGEEIYIVKPSPQR